MLKTRIFFGIFSCFLLSSIAFAQPNEQNDKTSQESGNGKSFEGSIRFVQITLNDTNYYTYHIKGRKVRLDVHENCNGCKGIENCMLFDLDKKTIIAVNPSRKLYINVSPKPFSGKSTQDYQIIKSNNTKKIQGYKCYQWRVKNKSENTEIAFWVADDNFLFFEDFLQLWNRSEKHAIYFLQIPDTKGFFPMISVERTTLREQKMKLEVIEILKKPVDNSLFDIPKDYQSYDH
ncbi:MAG: DUF4412 domain-containing protein [Bacteroidota bacterium]